MTLLFAMLAISLLAIGALILGFNLSLVVRWTHGKKPVSAVSAIPLLGGLAVGLGMACFPATRPWSWMPIVLDPAGVVAFIVALWRRRKGS
jgi:hypothetical protein